MFYVNLKKVYLLQGNTKYNFSAQIFDDKQRRRPRGFQLRHRLLRGASLRHVRWRSRPQTAVARMGQRPDGRRHHHLLAAALCRPGLHGAQRGPVRVVRPGPQRHRTQPLCGESESAELQVWIINSFSQLVLMSFYFCFSTVRFRFVVFVSLERHLS